MTTAQSRKAKGKRLEYFVRDLINLRLEAYGVLAKRVPLSGMANGFEGDVVANIPINIECKNTERHNVFSEFEQAEQQAVKGEIPILVMSKNRLKEPLAVITFSQLVKLLEVAIKDGYLPVASLKNEPTN